MTPSVMAIDLAGEGRFELAPESPELDDIPTILTKPGPQQQVIDDENIQLIDYNYDEDEDAKSVDTIPFSPSCLSPSKKRKSVEDDIECIDDEYNATTTSYTAKKVAMTAVEESDRPPKIQLPPPPAHMSLLEHCTIVQCIRNCLLEDFTSPSPVVVSISNLEYLISLHPARLKRIDEYMETLGYTAFWLSRRKSFEESPWAPILRDLKNLTNRAKKSGKGSVDEEALKTYVEQLTTLKPCGTRETLMSTDKAAREAHNARLEHQRATRKLVNSKKKAWDSDDDQADTVELISIQHAPEDLSTQSAVRRATLGLRPRAGLSSRFPQKSKSKATTTTNEVIDLDADDDVTNEPSKRVNASDDDFEFGRMSSTMRKHQLKSKSSAIETSTNGGVTLKKGRLYVAESGDEEEVNAASSPQFGSVAFGMNDEQEKDQLASWDEIDRAKQQMMDELESTKKNSSADEELAKSFLYPEEPKPQSNVVHSLSDGEIDRIGASVALSYPPPPSTSSVSKRVSAHIHKTKSSTPATKSPYFPTSTNPNPQHHDTPIDIVIAPNSCLCSKCNWEGRGIPGDQCGACKVGGLARTIPGLTKRRIQRNFKAYDGVGVKGDDAQVIDLTEDTKDVDKGRRRSLVMGISRVEVSGFSGGNSVVENAAKESSLLASYFAMTEKTKQIKQARME
ncbi:hypothetical protein HDV05_006575 [Chytridiales sp. JEL 0842]|nr:hypothetical protein HDV05_006575 [Chytridiales sp. JEL 0842]